MLELRLIAGSTEAFRSVVRELCDQGQRRMHVYPQGPMAEDMARYAGEAGCEARVGAPDAPAAEAGVDAAPCHILTETDPAVLSGLLLKLVDLESGIVVAPRTPHAFDARPLFLISIPKAGTHLLYSLAQAFGYHAGIICPEWPKPGLWYCLEHSNSHTRATDFFIDTVRRSPFGNRHHPFATSPALFIYRNPLDILVSEANYYHREGKTIFAGYLGGKSFEERLLTLISDPWLFGTFRDRMAGFVPWLDFPNVVPLSFEEIVGARGGGDDAVQRRLIWSLQLKLHVPGRPEAFASRVFNPDSPTFNEGRIGSHREKLTTPALRAFGQLPQDFMQAFGYAQPGGSAVTYLPERTEKFIRRPLVTAQESFRDTAIQLETDFHGYNIVRYHGRFYACTNEDVYRLSDAELSNLPSTTDLATLKQRLSLLSPGLVRLWARLAALARRLRS